MRDPLTDDDNMRACQQWAINVGHNWPVFHSSAGPALAARDGAVMSASTGPAPARRGMLTKIYCTETTTRKCKTEKKLKSKNGYTQKLQ